jgi:hypothetical protein
VRQVFGEIIRILDRASCIKLLDQSGYCVTFEDIAVNESVFLLRDRNSLVGSVWVVTKDRFLLSGE